MAGKVLCVQLTEGQMANIVTSTEEVARAKFRKYAKKKRKFPKNKSIRTISGGLPSLGKRR